MLSWLRKLLDGRIFTFSKRFYWTGYKQMKIKIIRLDATDKGIFGKLSLDGSKFECVTLERHDIAIPVGTYKVTMYDSPSHGYKVPLVNGVKDRSYIEIHCGNWEKDSKGCILVGSKRDGEAIEYSKVAFNKLMEELKGCTDISLEIR